MKYITNIIFFVPSTVYSEHSVSGWCIGYWKLCSWYICEIFFHLKQIIVKINFKYYKLQFEVVKQWTWKEKFEACISIMFILFSVSTVCSSILSNNISFFFIQIFLETQNYMIIKVILFSIQTKGFISEYVR